MTGLLLIGGVLQNAQGLINNSKVSVDGGVKISTARNDSYRDDLT